MKTFINQPDFGVSYEDFPVDVNQTDAMWNIGIDLPQERIVYPYNYGIAYFIADPTMDQRNPHNWRFSHINLWKPAPPQQLTDIDDMRFRDDVFESVTVDELNVKIAFTGYTVQTLFETILQKA